MLGNEIFSLEYYGAPAMSRFFNPFSNSSDPFLLDKEQLFMGWHFTLWYKIKKLLPVPR